MGVLHFVLLVIYLWSIERITRRLQRRLQRKKKERARHASAVHEAGHAVAVLVRGLTLTSVSINPVVRNGSPRDGECSYSGRKVESVFVLYAGPFAQIRAYPKLKWLGSNCDFSPAEEYLDEIFVKIAPHAQGLTKDLLRRYYRSAARKLVKEHWESIMKVADELLARQVLSGEEVKSLLPCALSSPRFPRAWTIIFPRLLVRTLRVQKFPEELRS